MLKIFISPRRANVRISVRKVKKDDKDKQLDWLLDEIKDNLELTPKTIIFVTHSKTASLFKLGELSSVPFVSTKYEDFIIGIFHSVSWPKMKDKLLSEFRMQAKKRLIIASTALSMGVNFGDVRYIINWGPARNILDQLQKAGRAGRDGVKSYPIIILLWTATLLL